MKNSPIYLTTPLYYVNAKPHIGHAYTTILADTLKRYHQQLGRDVLFLTGTDEHGEKIVKSAEKEGKSPLEFTDEVAAIFESTWQKIGLKPDIFYRTTQPEHYELVRKSLQHLKNKGDIHFASYSGKYCVGCERFRTDQEWDEGGLCPDHQTPPEIREESNYFFKMGNYQEKLKQFYESQPDSIVPSNYLKETLSMLNEPLEDLCISRPKERLEWGIPLPFDEGYVTYVWFDALLNYLGGLGFSGDPTEAKSAKLESFWAQSHHLIGKDILKTHAVYWPTMLLALGFEPAKQIHVNGFWLMGKLKMSKSLGNVVDPVRVHEEFGIEAFRYYLMKEMAYGGDASFTWESFIACANADLANGIGNLASRTLTLIKKNFDSLMPSRSTREAGDLDLLAKVEALPEAFKAEFEASRFHRALTLFAEAVAECDRYINEQKPWALAKDPEQRPRLEAVLGTVADCLSVVSIVMAPVLPEGSQKLRVALGFEVNSDEVPSYEAVGNYLPEGSALGEVPRLYPRLELPAEPS